MFVFSWPSLDVQTYAKHIVHKSFRSFPVLVSVGVKQFMKWDRINLL